MIKRNIKLACRIGLAGTAAFTMTLLNAANKNEIIPGVSYGGGKVACLMSEGGIANLIAASVDNSDGITWGGLGQAIGPGAQSDSDGFANTKAIIKTLGTDSNYAAKLCADYEIDAAGNTPCQQGKICYDDWFLPAKKQLDCLFKNRVAIGGFAKAFYSSSTEFAGYPAYSSWDRYFSDDEQPLGSEGDSNRVRCVRLFVP